MVARMNVQKRTKRRVPTKQSALKLAKAMHPDTLLRPASDAITLFKRGARDQLILTEHHRRALASNPNANISMSKKAAKKMKRKLECMQRLRQNEPAMLLD